MRQHDQQGTPWSQNWAEFKSAVKGEPRADGRNRLMAILHEGLNTFLVEPVRKYPKMSGFILLFLLVALLDCRVALAVEVDPNLQDSKTFTCTLPVSRTDGTALAVDEIAEVRFYESEDQTVWTQVGTNTVCLQVYSLTDIPDGTYYYTADVVDTDGRESIKSPEVAVLTVKRLASPAPPSAVGWQD